MTILCSMSDGTVVPLETIKQGFRELVGPMIGGSFEVYANPKGFSEVYRDPYTSAYFVKFVGGMDKSMRFDVNPLD